MKTKINKCLAIVIFAILCGGLMVGCEISKQFHLSSNETLVILFYDGGLPVKEEFIAPLSKKHELLSAWVEANKDGWLPTPITYVPGVYIKGKNFRLNFLKNRVILNFAGEQFIKTIDPKDYDFLLHDNK